MRLRHRIHHDLCLIKDYVRFRILPVLLVGSTKLAVLARGQEEKSKNQPVLEITKFPSTRTSIFVRRKQTNASSGLHMNGSFALNEVFSSMGTPVNFLNASISL